MSPDPISSDFEQNTATIRPFSKALLSIPEAASIYDIPERTLRRWCETGKIPAMVEKKAKRTSYLISPKAIEFILSQARIVKEEKQKVKFGPVKPHFELISPWIKSLQRGTLNGKVYSPETVKYFEALIRAFIKKHKGLNIQTLKTELASIPAVNFAKRYKLHKAAICFSKFLIIEKALDTAFLQEAKSLSPKRHIPPKRSTVNPEGLEKLLSACQTLEEETFVKLLANTGLRAAEACNLKLGDIDLSERTLTVQCGKGGKRRKMGLNSDAFEVLERYIKQHPTQRPDSYLLLNSTGTKLDRTSLYHRLRVIGRRAGVTVSAHALRRAFVTINANKGRSLVMLQHACGHSDITTTRSYCLTTEQEVIDAMKDW